MSSKRNKKRQAEPGVPAGSALPLKSGDQPASGTGAQAQSPAPASLQVLTGGDDTRLQRWEWFLLALIVLTGGFLRFWRMGMPSMWGDESGSLQLALRPIHDILDAPADTFPPVHYILLHYALQLFGADDWSARLPGVILGTAALPIQYLLARLLLGRRIAVISSLFMTLSMYQIYYCRDAHGYSIYAFFSWLSLYLFCKILYTGGKKLRHWFGYAVTSVLMILTHFVGTAACLEQALIGVTVLAVRIWKKYPWGPTKRLLIGFGVSAVVVAMGMFSYVRLMIDVISGKTTPADLGPQYLKITPELVNYIFTRQGFGNGIGLVLFATLLAAGIAYVFARSRRLVTIMLFWILFPYAVFATVDLGHFVVPRYFIFGYPVVAIFASCGILAVIRLGLRLSRGKSWGYAAVLPILIVWAVKMVPAYDDFYRMTAHDWPKKEMAEWVNANFPEGTTMLYENYYEQRWIGPDGYKMPGLNYAYVGIAGYLHEYQGLNMRERFKAFLEKYPETVFFTFDSYRDILGFWGWQRSFFAQRKPFTNTHGIMLARRGLSHMVTGDEIWQDDLSMVSGFAVRLYYNTEDDLIRKAREANRPVFRRLIRGFRFYLDRELRDWMVITDEGRIAVYQMDSVPRTVKVRAQAVGIGADRLEIAGPGGVAGSCKMVEGRLQEYVVAVSNLPPGKAELSLRVYGSQKILAGQPPAVLFHNIIAE